MKRYSLLILACFLACLTAEAQTGQFYTADRFSSSLINDLCQDSDGSLWVATDYGLNRYDGYSFQTFLHHPSDSTSLTDNMTVCLLADRQGRLWVGTRLGLDRFDAANETFVHYPFPDGQESRVSALLQLRDGRILVGTAGYGVYVVDDNDRLQYYGDDRTGGFYSRIYEDSKGRLWHSGFDETVTLVDQGQTTTFRSGCGNPLAFVEQDSEVLVICLRGVLVYRDGQLMSDQVDISKAVKDDVILWKALVSQSGDVYIGTRGHGVYTIAPGKNRKLEFLEISTHGIDMHTAKVSAMMFDRNGNLWLGCHWKGLVMLPLKPEPFQNWSFEGQGIRLGSTISSICEGDNGITWATVQGVGIYGFNEKGRVVAHPASPHAVEFIFRDKQKHFWVGTDNGLYDYDPLTGHYSLRVTYDCDRFNDMTSDEDGNIYISTFSRGFCVYNSETGLFKNFSMSDENDSIRGRLCNNWILAMMPDRSGRLWMATSNGVACYDPKGDTFRPFGWMQLLPSMMCYSLCETSRGYILIGTDRGLYVYVPGRDEAVPFVKEMGRGAPINDVLKDKVINYIVETNYGDLWCSTSMGLWQYDSQNHEFIGHVAGNGLAKKEYITNVGLHTDDDDVLFGHNDGLTVFSPRQMKITGQSLSDTLRLTGFRVGDQHVNASTVINGIRVTDGKPVSECIYFTLSYMDHTVSMAFSQFSFETAMNMSLEYRVNNDDWVRQLEGDNDVTLGHLQPGTYRVEVRAYQGNEFSPSRVVIITVRSPWYRSTAAYFIYFLAFVSLLVFAIVLWRRRANRQLDEEKMKFLINATHDIRSPLTIILSALKKLKASANIPFTEEAVDTIERNSQRILSLVNQILDVRKIDKRQMHLHCRETEMVQFVMGITKMFDFNARERSITLSVHHEGIERLPVWIDRSQFDKVITNLLSNAFKFTQDGGEITVEIESNDEQQFVFKVLDTGVGLDPDTMRHIFDRFYQGTNSRLVKKEGTGIGLNLCKMIVDMHHGTISASNRTDGRQGSVFTVLLPLGTAHLTPEEIDTPEEEPLQEVSSPASTEQVESDGNMSATNVTPVGKSASITRKRVLLVDDDEEIGEYVKQELHRFYKFGICHNGKEGLKELLTNDYDLVVSDVMMPEMDGFTMLRMIKSNLNLSHLPVVMLTSKSDVANRLEGLEHGADAFLAKPFDMDELHLTIENLIKGRRRLKGKFSGAQQQTDKLEPPEVKGNDEILMERIMKVVNKNLDDSEFNVEKLCQEVGISRAQLHRKMKDLTGLSTSEFIRNIRLEQAARLLKEKKINVTQVAYTVGFSNLAHFSTIFRKHFGIAPSEYAAQNDNP